MKLKVSSPIEIVLQTEIRKIDFEALDGHFTLLPRHVDFVSALSAGIVSYETINGKTLYMACNHGILVKKAQDIYLSVHQAILSENLQELSLAIKTEFKKEDEQRKELNTAMAKLEIGLSRGFRKLQEENTHGAL